MPSSPGPKDYQRSPQRFFYRGISLLPQDALPEGKVSYADNIRSWIEGTLTARNGSTRVTGFALGGAVQSIFRLNDPTGLNSADPARRFLGAAGKIWGGTPGNVGYVEVDAGYADAPQTAVMAAPVNSPQPWCYIGDFDRSRKIDTNLDVRSIGLPPPALACTASLAAIQTTYLNSINNGSWVPYGGEAGAVTLTTRLSTVVNAIIYDSGTTGMASVNLSDMNGVTEGATIDIGGAPETVIVQEVIPAVANTTIAAILYDGGANGYCTIQPTGSFALGQLEIPTPEEVARRYHDLDQPAPPRVTITRTVDFPVNGFINLNGIELVRIQSVAIGTDGVMSFRCFTAGTYSAGQAITGIPAFRAYFNTLKSGGDPAVAACAENTITPIDDVTSTYDGIQAAILAGPRDWSQTGNRAMQPDDIITFSVKVDLLNYVQFVRILLATNGGATAPGDEFVENYYQYEWRANDLVSAIQALGGTPVPTATMPDAQAEAVVKGQVDTFYGDQYGQNPLIIGGASDGISGGMSSTAEDDATRAIRLQMGTGGAPHRTDGFVSVGATPSRQLALGNNQWITLHCRVKDLTRVGTDPGQTLGNLTSAAVVLQVLGTASPIVVQYSDCYLRGGYGPDCGTTNPPYVYRARYRSTLTGERGNPSPSMRAGMPARRGRVALSIAGCTEPQCDVIDWFRFGGSLARWAYVRSSTNDITGGQVTDNDDMADEQIDGGETLNTSQFQPWPINDLPRSGTCNVAGTAVIHVTGDAFNTAWSPDTLIIINGRTTSLYGSPSSTTRLQVIDNCDSGTAVAWSIPSPTLLAQPLPCLWGGTIEGVWFHFACGDPNDPGALHWTHGNDPDGSSDTNTLMVTSPSEPLMNGCVADGVCFVWSTDQLYRITFTPGALNTFRADATACTRGLWKRWAFTVGDEGIYFVAKDGIYVTAWGSPAVSIIDPDLRPIFPRDGSFAIGPIHCLEPIDFTAPMILTRVDQMIYFDYHGISGAGHTLVYEPLYRRWTPDNYPSAVRARAWEGGPEVHDNVIGCASGNAYEMDARKLTDDGAAIDGLVSTPWANGGDARNLKQWGDCALDVDSGSSFDGILVQPVTENGTQGLATTIVGKRLGGRDTYLVEVGAVAGTPGVGILSRTFGLLLSWVTQINDLYRPLIYLWEPSFLNKGTPIARRASDWEDLGYTGMKFVQGVVIRANTFGVAKTVAVQGDNATQLTLTINHNGETTKAYPLAAAGGAGSWTPFLAELVRLLGTDDHEWTLLDWRFVWEPAPEITTQWETQDTTFDFPGFGSVHDAVLAYQSNGPTTLRIYHDQAFVDYVIPSSGGVYLRSYQIFQAAKGKSFRFRWSGDLPFRVFQRDTSMRVLPWGGDYTLQAPYGGPSRIVGAEL